MKNFFRAIRAFFSYPDIPTYAGVRERRRQRELHAAAIDSLRAARGPNETPVSRERLITAEVLKMEGDPHIAGFSESQKRELAKSVLWPSWDSENDALSKFERFKKINSAPRPSHVCDDPTQRFTLGPPEAWPPTKTDNPVADELRGLHTGAVLLPHEREALDREYHQVETPGSGGQCELKLTTAPAPVAVDPRLTAALPPETAQGAADLTEAPESPGPNFLSALARVKAAFGGGYNGPVVAVKGGVTVEENYIVVTLDNYYSVDAIRDAFGKIEFVALDYIPPGDGLPFDFATVKKFQILNWIMERDN